MLIEKYSPEPESEFLPDLKAFRVRALDFYIELCTQIRQRFSFNDPILNFLPKLEPTRALSGETSSIMPLVQHFPAFSESEYEEINIEWRQLADTAQIEENFRNLQFEDFWEKISSLKNSCKQPMFPLLGKLVKHILCLPHSSAAAERIFSQLNLIKSKLRNRLAIKTCNALLLSRELIASSGKTCQEWEPDIDLLKTKVQSESDVATLATTDEEADIDDLVMS